MGAAKDDNELPHTSSPAAISHVDADVHVSNLGDQPLQQASRWALVGQILSLIISLCVLAALYRLVRPESFGRLAVALPWVMVFRGLATLSWQAMLLQQPHWSDHDASLLFSWNLVVAAVVMSLCVGTGYFVSAFYDIPGIAHCIAGLSPTIVLAMLATFAQTLLERRLEWNAIVSARLAAQCGAGLLAIAIATQDAETFALIAQQVAELAILATWLWWNEPWRPQWITLEKLPVHWWQFHASYSIASLLFLIMQQIDKLMLGWWIGGSVAGQAMVGMYGQAFQLSQRLTFMLTGAWGPVFLSSLSRANHNERETSRLAQHFFGAIANLLTPLTIAGVFYGRELLYVLGGPDWIPAGELLQVFAILTLWQGFINLSGNLYTARSATMPMAIAAAIGTLLLAVALPSVGQFFHVLTLQERVRIVAITYVAVNILWSIPYLYTAMLVSRIRLADLWLALRPSVFFGLAMSVTIVISNRIVSDAFPTVQMVVGTAVGCVCYGGLYRSGILRRTAG
ncbi:MAG: oligosaccharide flippase family protein [Planctomycetota bacterium]|nr:oligosaccharide flippase family protein [Planctomycetota bacterium]MDA1179714.1 oligosaccharide flippase family protein [Planctomycetota bacterium]